MQQFIGIVPSRPRPPPPIKTMPGTHFAIPLRYFTEYNGPQLHRGGCACIAKRFMSACSASPTRLLRPWNESRLSIASPTNSRPIRTGMTLPSLQATSRSSMRRCCPARISPRSWRNAASGWELPSARSSSSPTPPRLPRGPPTTTRWPTPCGPRPSTRRASPSSSPGCNERHASPPSCTSHARTSKPPSTPRRSSSGSRTSTART